MKDEYAIIDFPYGFGKLVVRLESGDANDLVRGKIVVQKVGCLG